jgi:hypothetical protein
MLSNAAANKLNLEMLSNAAANKNKIADDKESRKEDSSTESDGPYLKYLDEAPKFWKDPEVGLLWPSCPPTHKEDSTTMSAGPPGNDPHKVSTGIPEKDSSSKPDTPDNSSSSEEANVEGENYSIPRGNRVANAAKRRKLQTAAAKRRRAQTAAAKRRRSQTSVAGGKPSGEYTLCRQHFILVLLCIYSIIINIF